MNELTVYKSEQFGEIRTQVINGEPMFCLIDICKALDIKNATDVSKRLESDEVTRLNLGGLSGETNFVTESGLYTVILRSDKEEAKQFRKWVTSEVLPSIRKHGVYAVDEVLANPDMLINALQALKEERAKNTQLVEDNNRMKPKEIFADAVSVSDTSILVGELAKLIMQNGKPIGQNKLFAWLRDKSYLIKGGSAKNMPTQKSMDLGLFEICEKTINNPDGSVRITKTPKVTGKGQIYFINKFIGKNEVTA